MCDEDRPLAARLFIWWILCLIFASLRFDDGVHVKPLELSFKDEGLFGVAWQTKVERKRVGTRFVVPRIGFSLFRVVRGRMEALSAHSVSG